MDNKFMPPPPTGMRNNMPPPPPPPKREPPKEMEENVSAVPNMENNSTAPAQSIFTPPRDFPPRFNDASIQGTEATTNDVLVEGEGIEDKAKPKEKKTLNLTTILYWGGFAVSVVLIGLFAYLLFI